MLSRVWITAIERMPMLFTLSHGVVLDQRAEGPAFDSAVGGPGYLRGQAALDVSYKVTNWDTTKDHVMMSKGPRR